MDSIMNRNNDSSDDGIVVIRNTSENMCGGTKATMDTKAPKIISSSEITVFSISSSFAGFGTVGTVKPEETIGYVYAHAVPSAGGTFLYLVTKKGMGMYGSDDVWSGWALIKNDIMPSLSDFTNEYELSKNNGFHSFTNGLPQNFGGNIEIIYADGEQISISNNQSPVFSMQAAVKIAKIFRDAMDMERSDLPDISLLSEIRFATDFSDGGFQRATLRLMPDGTGVNHKISKYGESQIYESEKEVESEIIADIKRNITDAGILAWVGMPLRKKITDDKVMTFVFSDGREITVNDRVYLPYGLTSGFFNIELEMTTKH